MSTEVLINSCFGGFGLSKGFLDFAQSRSFTYDNCCYSHHDNELRSDPLLISLIKEYGLAQTSDSCARITIQSVPKYYNWTITEYDGNEELVVTFPWESLARALLELNEKDPVLMALRNGELRLPEK